MRRRRTYGQQTVKVPAKDEGAALARLTRLPAALVVLQGDEADIGRHVWLDRAVTMGREPELELALEDEMISRQHCRVLEIDGQFLLEDLESTNGTLLNGERVDGRATLKPGDCIFLGSCVVKFIRADDLEIHYHAQMDARLGTDELTGLVARRRFDVAFARAFEAARAQKAPLAVLMIDLDGLKQINDTHGHPVGAYTIATVGRIIGEVVSPHGAACRLGGDEFAAFLRGLTKPVAVDFGESIRGWVAKHHFEQDGAVVRPTISIGVAAFPTDGKTPDRLMLRADQALYRAKRAGRDRVNI